MRLLGGRPLVEFAINIARQSAFITDIAVLSDSEEVLGYVSNSESVKTFFSERLLSDNGALLDSSIRAAIMEMCDGEAGRYSACALIPPISPLLSCCTLDRAFRSFFSEDCDSLISAVKLPRPLFSDFPRYRETEDSLTIDSRYGVSHLLKTGTFVITKELLERPYADICDIARPFEIPNQEARAIESSDDWIACETALTERTIVFRVDGYKEIGFGHVYRALTLAYKLIGHRIIFVCDEHHKEARAKLEASGMQVVSVSSDDELVRWLEGKNVDVFINDRLDSEAGYVKVIKKHVKKFVALEDLGDGAYEADVVINAIYEQETPYRNFYTGSKYACLRDEFLIAEPSEFSEVVDRVVVLFGGTDPLNITSRIYSLAKKWNSSHEQVHFDFILGPGYSDDTIRSLPELGIEVNRDVIRVSDHFRKASLAFSAQGRTVFELASLGVPSIIFAQNKREKLHTFAQMDNGFINLGLGSEVSDADILSTFEWLLKAKSIRYEMRKLMLEKDLKSGIDRVVNIILR